MRTETVNAVLQSLAVAALIWLAHTVNELQKSVTQLQVQLQADQINAKERREEIIRRLENLEKKP